MRHNSFSFLCHKSIFNIIYNRHIIYHSSFLIMASSAKQLICPRCKTGNFNSERALNIHFNFNSESCQNLSLWAFSSKSTKQKFTFGSNLKFASSILDNINKRHHSGLSRNVSCLLSILHNPNYHHYLQISVNPILCLLKT